MKNITILAAALVFALILPASAAVLYDPAVLGDNPALYYRLDETSGTTAHDSATADGAQNGTYNSVGITLNQPGALTGGNPPDSAVAFAPVTSSTGGYIDSTFVLNPTAAFTVEFWFNPASLAFSADESLDQMFLSQKDSGPLGRDVVYWNSDTQKLSSFLGGSDHPWTTNEFVVGQYTLVDFVYNGAGTYTWYANGVADGTGSMTPGADSGTVVIGAHKSENVNFVNGTLDEFAIYTTALTSTQVAAHFTAASAPEPTSLAILGIGAALLLRRKASYG